MTEYERGFNDGCNHMKEDYEVGRRIEVRTQDAKIKALVEALEELVTCVDDGCYCSEMKMASAIDTANETIAAAKETT